MNPDNDETNVIGESDSVTLECSFDGQPETCIWTHNEPMNAGQTITSDISCSSSKESSGQNCKDESRVQFTYSGNKCGIIISDTQPEDTGSWRLNAVGLSTSQGGQVSPDDQL